LIFDCWSWNHSESIHQQIKSRSLLQEMVNSAILDGE
jgi:hypothetical protein